MPTWWLNTFSWICWINRFQAWPFRGLARSHRYSAGSRYCADPVGAGKPAKRPVQEYPRPIKWHQAIRDLNGPFLPWPALIGPVRHPASMES
ncbi:hypothetical protein EFK07_14030 [Pseudomonas putida]|uniref:Uncharacterized protein n=1 Tax=Pseudomonas putida TaxID=303 RepID=A0A3M8T3F7_PSEPU|nr:hypothetical protein EFK07_14030 [Pseudomonas putida]